MTFFYFLVGICLAFEIHKLFDFRNFSRLNYTLVKYTKQIKNRGLNAFSKAVLKISAFNLFYYVLIIIGFFGINSVFFITLMIMSLFAAFYCLKKGESSKRS